MTMPLLPPVQLAPENNVLDWPPPGGLRLDIFALALTPLPIFTMAQGPSP